MTGAAGGASPKRPAFPELFDPTCESVPGEGRIWVELFLPPLREDDREDGREDGGRPGAVQGPHHGPELAFCSEEGRARRLPSGRLRLGPELRPWFSALVAKARSRGLSDLADSVEGTIERFGRRSFTIAGRSRSLSLGTETRIMGVLNRTPDSFSDGGVFMGLAAAVDHGLRMAEAGASVIDVGGESTRPGSLPVPPEVQVERVCPVLERIRARSDVILSVDTTRAAVAEEALRAGADWVNDTSSLAEDRELLPLLARERVPVVLMHRPAPPRTMQESPSYEDAPGEVRRWLRARIAFGLRGGLDEHRIVVDPGIGFGKRLQDNLDCLVHLGGLSSLGLPILVGTSRKSFLGSLTGGDVSRRIWGTAATVALASWLGAHLVRVHDVSEMVDVIRVADAMRARARED